MKENKYIYFHQILEVKEVWQEMRTNSRHCEPGCAAAASPAEARQPGVCRALTPRQDRSTFPHRFYL